MQRINQEIQNGNFQQVYLLYGEERYLVNQYKTKLRNALGDAEDQMNNHLYRGKDISVGEIIDLAETLPFLAERRVIMIEDSGLFKSGGEQMAEYLANQILSDSILEYYLDSDKDDIEMVHNKVGEDFEPKSLIQLNLRNKFHVNIVGMFNDKGAFYIPNGDDKLAPGKIVVVVGKKNDIKKFDDNGVEFVLTIISASVFW